MGIREKELERLVNYAKGLNISIKFKKDFPGNDAAGSCTTDAREIEIFKSKSKIEIIMTCIHEIAHALFSIHEYDRVPPSALNEAFCSLEDKKRERRIIYIYERDSAAYWDIIYKETEMSFPYYWLQRQRDFDVWQYLYWWQHGEWPSYEQKIAKRKKLRRKYVSETIK